MTHPARAHGRPAVRGAAVGRAALAVPPEELPADPGSLRRDALAFLGEHRARLGRLGLHLLVAALPLLAISAHVFGLAPMNVTAGLVVVPLTLAVLLLAVFSPVGEDRIVLTGAVWGVIATLVYDAVRLDTVYLLGWWGDFIPTVGTWILGAEGGATAVGAIVGYLWRYVGDGGGIGVVFFVLVAATGLRRWGERATVAAAVVFAVFPVWTGLIATVAVAPRGEQLMFPLTVTTVTLSLLGHLVFGLVLGLGCARCRGLEERWPWPPLLDRPWAGVAAAPLPPPGAGRAAADRGWGPPALVAAPARGRTGGAERTAIPEAPGEITEIRVERPVPRRPGRSPSRTPPPSAPLTVGPDSGPVPVRREPVSGPVRVVGTPSHPFPVPGVPVARSAPARPAGPRPPVTGPWSHAVPREGSDPWLGAPASVRRDRRARAEGVS
ncbi:hypothetical protein PHK61_00140 [Actinomycetospora lutea]|uniref:hypothetical protein n=1 Tax=Actinomycetospora lutea TaxID=663604 RepID=UPI0023664BEA|nr:hypothetical protein [Actinomycetospora lutea]MDD7936823.1 hypothetical protein [Actinomycetospora lutea]